MDFLTTAERSKRMSLIKGKWTKQEKKMHNFLKGRKIKHCMHPPLPENPDILVGEKTAIFLNGCFWHKCPKCYKEPQSRKEYWIQKIEQNVKRDRRKTRLLREAGYKVVNIWEHDMLKNFERCFKRVTDY